MKPIKDFQRKIQWVLGLHAVWLLTISLLAFWWGYVLLHQADRISDLEKALGLSQIDSTTSWLKNRRMLFWESLTFALILIGMSFALFWFYWQDLRKSRALQMFFAGLSHELKTPLTSIRLQAETLNEQVELPAIHKKKIQRLLTDTERLHLQLNKMLELARLERGSSIPLQPIWIEDYLRKTLGRILEESPQEFREQTQFDFHFPDSDRSMVLADPFALEILLRNTLDNIYRHSNSRPFLISVSRKTDRNIRIEIKDNGTNPPKNTMKLGNLFEKGDRSSGTGIGLYLTTQIMKEMKGRASFFWDHGFVVQLDFKKEGDTP